MWASLSVGKEGKEILGKIGIGLIQVKKEGWTGFFEGLQGCSEGFPEGEARGNS